MGNSSYQSNLVLRVNINMKFKNKMGMDVYIDIEGLRQVKAGEIVDLKGTLTCPPLTPILETAPPKPKKYKKKTSAPPTSGTI